MQISPWKATSINRAEQRGYDDRRVAKETSGKEMKGTAEKEES